MKTQTLIQSENILPPEILLFEMATGFMKTQVLYVAAKLKLADILDDNPTGIKKLASATKTDSEALSRLMRSLISLGVIKIDDDQRYSLTALGKSLCSKSPTSLRSFVLLTGNSFWWKPWGEFLTSVSSGKNNLESTLGTDYIGYLKADPELAKVHNQCMSSVSNASNPALLNGYDFHGYETIVDVGGGEGSLLQAILQKYPEANGILFDIPPVIESCAKSEDNSESRIKKIGGNFFESVPKGGDLYILKQIIHDWNDELCGRILHNCRKAMNENGKVLIIENIINAGDDQVIPNLFDLHMLVMSDGGKERTKEEFHKLITKSGFHLNRIIKTESSYSILELIPFK